MPPNDKKYGDNAVLTSAELQNILEVNKKSIELHIEISEQFDDIIDHLKSNEIRVKDIDGKVSDIDKAFFKLLVILSVIMSSLGVGTVIAIVQYFLEHK